MVDDVLVQHIVERPVDIRSIDDHDDAFTDEPFDLATADVFRVGWRQTGPERHRLVFVLHHVAVDELSLPILFDDFADAYRAAAAGHEPGLKEPATRYLDLASRERGDASGTTHATGVAFWRQHLDGVPTQLRFAVDRDRPVVQEGRGLSRPVPVPADLGRLLSACLRREGITAYQFWLSVFGLFVAREVGARDLLVGAPSANRPYPDSERVVGFFVNTLPVRLDLRTNPTVAEYLADTARSLLLSQQHEHVPLQDIVAAVHAHRDAATNPLFQTMVVLEPAEPLTLALGAAHGRAIDLAERNSTLDLTLVVRPGPNGSDVPGLRLVHNPGLFTESDLDRMQATFSATLLAVLTDPERRVGDPVPPAPEHASVLVGAAAPAEPIAVPTAVAATARRFPDRIALVADGESWTYERLAGEAGGIAAAITAAGPVPDFVPVLMAGSPRLVAAMLAITGLGAAFVPVSPDWPTVRVQQALDRVGSALVVTDASAAALDLGGRRRMVDTTRALEWNPQPVDLDAAMYAIFTSGSTGEPKAAAVSHRGVANRFAWMSEEFGAAASGRVLQTTPPYFDSSVWEYLWPLATGGTSVLGGPVLQADPARLCTAIAEHGITTLDMVPGLFRGLLDHLAAHPDARGRLRSLQVAVVGGEELTVAVTDLGRRVGLTARLYNLYGPTEASIGSIAQQVTGAQGPRVPIGRPITGTSALVLDDDFVPVPRGVRGELFLGGACVGLGYLGTPAETRARFLDLPAHGRVYRTGDVVRVRNDGALEFLGRCDDQFNVNGVRVEAGEIVRSLESLDGVADAGVLQLDADQDLRRIVTDFAVDAAGSGDATRRADLETVLTLVEQIR